MADYRVYVLDTADKIAGAMNIQARDDEHAFEIADRIPGAKPVEIWQGTRLVGRYKHDQLIEVTLERRTWNGPQATVH